MVVCFHLLGVDTRGDTFSFLYCFPGIYISECVRMFHFLDMFHSCSAFNPLFISY